MKLKTTLFGNVYQFKDVKEVLAKANELRSGDVLAGVAAASSQERVAAKQVLSEMTVADIRNNPVIAYEDDCVTRLIQDDVNETAYNLDIDTIRWLEQVLNERDSTMIIISHDRHFLNMVCTHMADLDYGELRVYPGNYDEYMTAATQAREIGRAHV